MIKSIENVKNVILISSGKGGVGKSMVASNLAVALSRDGYVTGLLDADLYGPSVPLALGLEGHYPLIEKEEGAEKFEPVMNYGIKVMSLGFLMKKEDAIIWRGPLVSNALTQLLENTRWGELDFLIVDMPPGTGDINITLAQKLPHARAIVVITPQQMAMTDGRKAANMFRANGIDIEVAGIVENMSWFIPEQHPDEKYMLFGEGGGMQLAGEIDVPLLAQIPLVSDVCKLGDTGKTIFASSNNLIIKVFEELAEKLTSSITVES